MSYELLMKSVAAADAVKASKQENNTPAPNKDVKVESNENVNVTKEGDLGGDPTNATKTSNENDTDVKPESETSKDEKVPKKSELTEKQKQEYAFRKQWGMQEKKHKSEMEMLRKEVDELKKSSKGPDPVITRDNFDTEEEFESYKDEARTQKILERLQKEKESEHAQNRFVEEKRSEVTDKIKTIFEAPEDLKLYNEMVTVAIQDGLEDYLNSEDKNKTIKSFIDNSSIGPRVLQHLIGFPDKMKEIYNMSDPIDKKVELKLLERELQYDIQTRKSAKVINKTEETKSNVPILGKLGTTGSGNTNTRLSKAEEDLEAMKFIRGR